MTRIDELFLDAHELGSAAQRKAFLDAQCAGDPDLRGRVEAMLAAAAQADVFFGEAVDGGRKARRAALKPLTGLEPESGTVIGRFKLVELLGEGGFGMVWMAEQQEPVRRKVALKIIKAGMDTKEVVARFEQERQALAMMDHPNIAQVFEAGSTELGRPYFVMELVKGVPVTQFCDEQCLPMRERLALFMDVCLAIQHAHQKGIIHRDIKPSNILGTMVDGKPVIKVIDFGIARAVQQSLTDKTLLTHIEQFMGTPAYMSPEQARGGRDIDTRSDIYSLGVLLYELLTGVPPFERTELLRSGYQEIRRVICEDEPRKPSTRLGTMGGEDCARLARARQVEPARLEHFLKGDLDWIVMRAIEKDRVRRYGSASALAEDILHFLGDKPVSATPPGRIYLLGKFARRHRTVFIAGAAVAAALIVGLTATTWMFFKEREAKDQFRATQDLAANRLVESEAAQREATEISNFLVQVIGSSNPDSGRKDVTMAEILDDAAAKLPAVFEDQRDVRALLQKTLALSYSGLGLTDKAIPLMEDALAHTGIKYGNEAEQTWKIRADLAALYNLAGNHAAAVPLFTEALGWSGRHGHPEKAFAVKIMTGLGEAVAMTGASHEAIEALQNALSLSGDSLGTELVLKRLAEVYTMTGHGEEGLAAGRRALELSVGFNGTEHPVTIELMHTVAKSFLALKDPANALDMAQPARDLSGRIRGKRHPGTALIAGSLGNALALLGRRDEAIEVFQESLEITPSQPGVQLALGAALCQAKRWEEAVPVLQAAVPAFSAGENRDTLTSLLEEARRHVLSGEGPRSLPEATVTDYTAELEKQVTLHPGDTATLKLLALLYLWQERPDDHRRICRILLDSAEKSAAATEQEEAARVCLVSGKTGPELGRSAIRAARQALEKTPMDDKLRLPGRRLCAGIGLYRDGRNKDAEKQLAEVLKTGGAEEQVSAQLYLGLVQWRMGKIEEARASLREAKKGMPPVWAGRRRLTDQIRNPVLLFQWLACMEASTAISLLPQPKAVPLSSNDKPAPGPQAVIVPPDSEWKWLHPMTGRDPALDIPLFHTTFFLPGFDDTSWNTARDSPGQTGGFGYGEKFDFAVDIGSPKKGHRNSAYFRHAFTTGKTYTNLQLQCQFDDGVIVYLDGHAVHRENVMDGPESYRLPARSSSGAHRMVHTWPISKTLGPGPHVLAVSVHNNINNSISLGLGGVTLLGIERK